MYAIFFNHMENKTKEKALVSPDLSLWAEYLQGNVINDSVLPWLLSYIMNLLMPA